MLSLHKCTVELFELQCNCLAGTVLGRNRACIMLVAGTLLGRNKTWLMVVAGTATWQEQDLVHVGGKHITWQEQGLGSCWWQPLLLGSYLAHVGGRHNTLLVKGCTAGFK